MSTTPTSTIIERLEVAAQDYELLAASNRDRYLVELLRDAVDVIQRLREVAEPFADKEAGGTA